MIKDFAVFILTHGRAGSVKTYTTLRRHGYTGPIYLVIDNEDDQAPAYYSKYGDQVIMFDKSAAAKTFDECDNFKIPRRTIVYARNASFQIAKDLGLKWFLQLDDDYTSFEYRFTPELKPTWHKAQNLDRLFAIVLDFYKSIPALTVALAQGGDMLGGAKGNGMKALRMKRKAMNTFFCSVDRPFVFTGRINEDVNAYVVLGTRGALLLTIYNASIVQMTTQKQAGGMTDIYQMSGNYLKSFYTVMQAPSCVTLTDMGETERRIHHHVNWRHAVPVIMSEQYRKE